MFKSQNSDEHRLQQIASIARSEPLGSPLYLAHVGLLLFGGIGAILLFDMWIVAATTLAYVALFSYEKWVAALAFRQADASRYGPVLLALFLRAIAYNVLVVVVWSLDGDIFKLAAMALLVAATINIMVFHATYVPIIACVVGPIWAGLAGIVALFFAEFGFTAPFIAAALVLICISPYFYLALANARHRFADFELAQQALNRSERQKILGNLVAGVAHDFNNILAVTLGNAELLKAQQSDEDRQRFADEIIKAATRGASLSGQLLTFAGRARLHPDHHAVGPILSDLKDMVDRVFPPGIETSTDHHAAVTTLFVDREQLDIALLNLAINARDAMPKGGHLRVSVEPVQMTAAQTPSFAEALAPGRYVRVRVQDDGIGIAPDIRDQVFDPFFTTKPVGDGSGLGLSMVLGLAKQSGGTVTLDSSLGDGTIVDLYLPDVQRTTEQPAETEAQVAEHPARHILIVEDETSVRQMLENQLSAEGNQISVASNGEEGAALLASGLRPDVVITDNIMPGVVQGTDLVRMANALSPPIPCVIVSGYPQELSARLQKDGSTALILAKPTRKSDILEAIERTLR